MIETYDDLLQAAHAQVEPQRLLLVFCQAELPDDASAAEKAAFERGEGGALVPVLCVDKAPEEAALADLLAESAATGQHWDLMFVAALSGRGGIAPGSDEAQQPLTMMVESVKLGHVGGYLAVTRGGELVDLG